MKGSLVIITTEKKEILARWWSEYSRFSERIAGVPDPGKGIWQHASKQSLIGNFMLCLYIFAVITIAIGKKALFLLDWIWLAAIFEETKK